MAIISIDFDNCITKTDNYPKISGLKPGAKKVINWLYDNGHCILINTCRCGREEEQAYKFLIKHGVKFCHINKNCNVRINEYNNDTRKLGCHINIDDKNIETLYSGGINWEDIKNMLEVILSENNYDHRMCSERYKDYTVSQVENVTVDKNFIKQISGVKDIIG